MVDSSSLVGATEDDGQEQIAREMLEVGRLNEISKQFTPKQQQHGEEAGDESPQLRDSILSRSPPFRLTLHVESGHRNGPASGEAWNGKSPRFPSLEPQGNGTRLAEITQLVAADHILLRSSQPCDCLQRQSPSTLCCGWTWAELTGIRETRTSSSDSSQSDSPSPAPRRQVRTVDHLQIQSPSQPMQSLGFPRFSTLPTELQDYIWDLAARPFPGDRLLHTFYATADHFIKFNDAVSFHGDELRLGDMHGQDRTLFGLLVPWDGYPEEGPNTSAYRATSGLWMACTASRRAVQRAFPKNEWWSGRPGAKCPHGLADRGRYLGDPDASHTASYTDREGKLHYITISPQRDIVHFPWMKLFGGGPVDWHYHYASDHVPLLDERVRDEDSPPPVPRASFLGMDLAVDFDPRWSIWDPPSDLVDTLDLFHDGTSRNVWFVDRRLRRRSGSPDDAQKFYSCGYVYTEVKRSHQYLWEIHSETSTQSVYDWLPRLARMHSGRLEGMVDSPYVSVLACEENPKDPSLHSLPLA